MKKWRVVLPLLVIILLFNSTSFAANRIQYSILTIDGKKQTVREVPVLIDGQPMVSDVPSFIYKDRTLVPVRFITNYLKAGVEWNQKNKSVTISTSDKKIVLVINSPYVNVNGVKQKLPYDMPAKLVNDRTMVPLRFVSETLGCKVDWDDENGVVYIQTSKDQENSITGINVDKDSTRMPRITVNGTGTMKYKTITLEKPDRLVIDIENAKLDIKDNAVFDENGIINIPVGKAPVDKVCASQFSASPSVTRLVVHLTKKVSWNITSTNGDKTLEVSFANKVQEIRKETVDGNDAIVIYNTEIPQLNVLKLKNPDRIVVDLLDSSIGNLQNSYGIELGFIKGIRVAQFTPDALYDQKDRIVRVVLDVKEGVSEPNVKIDTYDNKIVIYPEKAFWEGVSYENAGDKNFLTINAKNSTEYTVNFDHTRKTMDIYVPKDNVELNNGMVVIKDGIVNNIVVEDEGQYKKISIFFRTSILYNILSAQVDSEIKIQIEKDQEINSTDRLIVLDAGHGGKDPGAISPNGNKEKDINLDITLKLNERLNSLGYKTVLTRDYDTFIDLYERPNIANINNGDIFISIHSNAIADKNISGLQVLYCPATESTVKEVDNFPLADMIYKEVLAQTGAVDRGIIKRPKLVVLRETRMPAVLVEVGFITNPTEEKLILDSEYQDKIVEGIIRGIERYFEEAVY